MANQVERRYSSDYPCIEKECWDMCKVQVPLQMLRCIAISNAINDALEDLDGQSKNAVSG